MTQLHVLKILERFGAISAIMMILYTEILEEYEKHHLTIFISTFLYDIFFKGLFKKLFKSSYHGII